MQAGAIAVAVAALLLFSSGALAELLSDVPVDHWSYRALARLQDAGMIDPSGRGAFHPDQPHSRYEIALRVDELVRISETLMTGRVDPDLDPLTAFKAEYAAARRSVSRARSVASELVRLHLDVPSPQPPEAVVEFLYRLEELSDEFEALFDELALLLELARQPSAFIADRSAYAEAAVKLEALTLQTIAAVEEVLGAEGDDEEAAALRAAVGEPTLAEGLEVWTSLWRTGEPGESRFFAFPGTRLAADLQALMQEYGDELRLFALSGGEESGSDVDITAVGDDRAADHARTGEDERAWDRPAIGGGMPVESVEAERSVMASWSAARAQRRTELGEELASVDLDRLYALRLEGSGGVNPGAGAEITAGQALDGGEEGAGSLALGGRLSLTDAASLRIGYDLDLDRDGKLSALLDGSIETGIEYRLGDRTTLEADYRFSPKDIARRSQADIGIGVRINDDTTISAQYSKVRLESETGESSSMNRGEAELSVRF